MENLEDKKVDRIEAVDLQVEMARSYLDYAMSVIVGRALPDIRDGLKPVHRRVLYAMYDAGYRPDKGYYKSSRIVGDVMGNYHPHGDGAIYDTLVRLAQHWSLRYPLVDGNGNFGSPGNDPAAAMRYTEARMAPLAMEIMRDIDEETVDFIANYDGRSQEPLVLPSRFPNLLVNGSAGIAVGMATNIPPHNLREIAGAVQWALDNPDASNEETLNALLGIVKGPDFPTKGIIVGRQGIEDAYRTGRGSLKVRARWKIEDMARGQWQLVVTELPIGVSSQKVLEEIEELTNPKVKAGKKALSADQMQLKASILSVLDVVRDESSKDAAVRLVFEPKTSRIEQQELITALLAHTSLETSSPINMTSVGIDGKPVQKSLRQMISEWITFRQQTIVRRSEHRLNKVMDRIHILEGRQLVLLNIDEVIAIIRQSDEPKQALMTRFKLSERQAEDILDIRLRQLARLEGIKIEQELKELRTEQTQLEEILANPSALRRLMVKEIEQDAKAFADPRRTLIQEEKKAVAEVKVVDEPVTVVVSEKGWVRARQGHGHDASSFAFKAGDGLYGAYECRTVDTLLAFGTAQKGSGRVYSVPVAALPGARGDGQPVTTLIELEPGTQIAHYFAGPSNATLLLSSSGGYGFMATVDNMISRQKGGKAFLTVGEGESVCAPSHVSGSNATPQPGAKLMPAATHVACASTGGRILTFEISELKLMEKGGRGLMLLDLEAKDTLAGAAAYTRSVKLTGIGRGGKDREETLEIRSLNNARAARARKGKSADLGFKPTQISRVE